MDDDDGIVAAQFSRAQNLQRVRRSWMAVL